MTWFLLAVGAIAAVYQLLALAACLRHRLRTPAAAAVTAPEREAVLCAAGGPAERAQAPGPELPAVSLLKPLHGLDADFYECIRSHAVQDYPRFEILFGISDPNDPAKAEVERLMAEYPRVPMRLILATSRAANQKVAVLEDLAAAARHPVLLVNDSDIRVPEDYLRRVTAPLADERVGMVTCLYRARAGSWAGRVEALGITTDFVPSVLVAPLFGVSEFALGSTMVFRRADLERIGGFAAVAEFIADDYQLSARIRGLGLHVVLSDCVVDTSLPDSSWGSVWKHQVRWARTVRVSRGDGYVGLPVTFATLWALALALAGMGWAAAAVFASRLMVACAAAVVLRHGQVLPDLWLLPLRDLAAVAVWAAGLFGRTVVWRDQRLLLRRDGRIQHA